MMRIVFATAEVSPFAKTGGLGDVCGSLPKALARRGHDVAVFTPYYRQTGEYFARHPERHPPEPVIDTIISWAGWSYEMTLLRAVLPNSEVPVYFVANDHFFARPGVYSPRDDGFDDHLERFTFFCRSVIVSCEMLGIAPDIVHAHDWHTALLPLYLDSGLRTTPIFANTASVFTIHNGSYQGRYGLDRFWFTGLHSRYLASDALEYYSTICLMKGALVFSDQLTTVSPTYATEIQTSGGGAGLDGEFRANAHKLTGILNGVDYHDWDPATDRFLDARYERGKLLGKKISKRMLCRQAGLRFDERTPLFGFVSRLVQQKGIDLLVHALPQLVAAGAQVMILGSGEAHFEDSLLYFSMIFPRQVKTWIGFDNPLAHRIFAASDMFLMPSLYEPCGLNQMYALRYGSLPLARLTGGLADTVVPWDGTNRRTANGFGFIAPTGDALAAEALRAIVTWKNTRLRKTMQDNGMQADYSWERSAEEYESVYAKAQRT